jgi:hypothetical protein
MIAFTAYFCFSTTADEGGWVAGTTGAVRILRILSEGVSILLTILIAFTLDTVLWASISRKEGASFSTVLSLNTGTGTARVLELLFKSRKATSGLDLHRVVVTIRYVALQVKLTKQTDFYYVVTAHGNYHIKSVP